MNEAFPEVSVTLDEEVIIGVELEGIAGRPARRRGAVILCGPKLARHSEAGWERQP
eukprot:CAMPEP_0195133274 /NCGR_PEP_ID=MMETSP0448-20130528/148495_1 /TAXON_ID=66468 /ORGANISM="Heterocapsa triquestra, Strain CCMP 448" /LENGTH=55 /DNA_ID=CAMNT_0040171319 /DNA_START=143 /DNA_END=310 /DNA_ORIENTATION=-